jgi:hypothetical protein
VRLIIAEGVYLTHGHYGRLTGASSISAWCLSRCSMECHRKAAGGQETELEHDLLKWNICRMKQCFDFGGPDILRELIGRFIHCFPK